MQESQTSFYITTAIDYPNALPHMGHAYEKIVADFYARAARLRGRDTWFLIGLDEHGLKIEQAARAAGQSPQEFVDGRATTYRDLYDLLAISSDDFVRTSEPRHHRFAQELYRKAKARGDIYKGLYETEYCVACERALQKSEVAEGHCSTCGRPIDAPEITRIQEETYFFKLSAYRDRIRDHIEHEPGFIVPEWRRNEVLSRLNEEVYDLSISRSTFHWGVPVPDDPEHVLYVWVDALSNYISALLEPDPSRERFWPADCHVIGKDILWFHTVIWPALLLSAGYPLPRQVYVHGFILDRDGRKMSKSLGNVVDPVAVVKEWGVDTLRFYFLRAFASGQDGNFSLEELEERYRSELGNDLGNLVMRLSKLALSRAGGKLEPANDADDLGLDEAIDEFFSRADAREHHRSVEALWALLRRTNAYLNDTAPWKVKDEAEVRRILYSAFRAADVALHLLEPVMPKTARDAASFLGVELGSLDRLRAGGCSYEARPAEALFPRREPDTKKATDTKAAPQPDAASTAAGDVDPFARLEIRIGRIEEVREHPDADALWALIVDIGGEKRSICAGLRAHVTADELRGRKVAVLANLKPAKLRGIESRGMILATDARSGKVVPVDPGDAESGDLVRVEGIAPEPKSKLAIRDFEKTPLEMKDGVVTYRGRELRTGAGPLRADADDGASVR